MTRLILHNDVLSYCLSLLAYLGHDNPLLSVEIRSSITYSVLTAISIITYITNRRLSLNQLYREGTGHSFRVKG
jgi:hypothetical protein